MNLILINKETQIKKYKTNFGRQIHKILNRTQIIITIKIKNYLACSRFVNSPLRQQLLQNIEFGNYKVFILDDIHGVSCWTCFIFEVINLIPAPSIFKLPTSSTFQNNNRPKE